jgi:hypothetical protein
VSDFGAILSTIDETKETLATTAASTEKSKAIEKLDDRRRLVQKHLAAAQEECREAIKTVKAFRTQRASPKKLARQDLCMMDALLLLHTEDPNMTLGELREKMMNTAILVHSKKLTVSRRSKTRSKT